MQNLLYVFCLSRMCFSCETKGVLPLCALLYWERKEILSVDLGVHVEEVLEAGWVNDLH